MFSDRKKVMTMAEYIEREAAISEIRESCGPCGEGVEAVKRVPSAEVAPVRHGRWDENGRCTVCGGHAPYLCMSSTYYESPYCFECGAKMDGDG